MFEAERIKEVIATELVADAKDFGFAYASELTTAPNPGLFVKDVGAIGLPLGSHEAEEIISHCRPSPFGKGTETIVDPSVRNSVELEPGQFELRNSAWTGFITTLVSIVHAELGLACGVDNVEAQLYKLLLYRPGAFFKAHQDSEKAKGMFGTLVVCLGSLHKGGTVVLEHKKKKYVFESSKTPLFGTSFAAWYSDVSHEVQEVTEGYRLVLTYNLIQKGVSIPERAPLSGESKRLVNALTEYNKAINAMNPNVPPYLAYKLDHPYTEESIGIHSLKGQDRTVAERFQAAGKDLGFRFYLAMFTKKITYDESFPFAAGYNGYGSHYDIRSLEEESEEEIEDRDKDEEVERAEYFDLIYDLQGNEVNVKPEYSPRVLLDPDNCATDEDSDHESEHEGFTGNEGAPVHRTYRDTMLLAVPPASSFDFLVGENLEDTAAILDMLNCLKSSPESQVGDSADNLHLRRLCTVLASKTRTMPRMHAPGLYDQSPRVMCWGKFMKLVIEVSLKNNWLQLYETISPDFRLMRPALETLGHYLARVGLNENNEKVVSALIKSPRKVEAAFDALSRIRLGFNLAVGHDEEALKRREQFSPFERKIWTGLLEDYKTDQDEFGLQLADIMIEHEDRFEGLASAVEDIISASPTPVQAAFALECAGFSPSTPSSRNEEGDEDDKDDKDDENGEDDENNNHDADSGDGLHTKKTIRKMGPIVGRTLDSMWASFIFEGPELPVSVVWDLAPPSNSLSSEEILALLGLTARFQSCTRYTPIQAIQAMQKTLSSITTRYAKTVILPLAEALCRKGVDVVESDESQDLAAVAKALRFFVAKCFAAVIQKVIGPEPQMPTDFSLPRPPNHSCNGSVQHGSAYLNVAPSSSSSSSRDPHRIPCEHCARVIAFLASPTETNLEIPAGQAIRRHLDGQFINAGDPTRYVGVNLVTGPKDLLFHVDIIRQPAGRPFIWAITKTHQEKYTHDHDAWQGRFDLTKDRIAQCLSAEESLLALTEEEQQEEAKGKESADNAAGVSWSEIVQAIASAKLEEVKRVGLVESDEEEEVADSEIETGSEARPGASDGAQGREPLRETSANEAKKRAWPGEEKGGESNVTAGKRQKD